MNSFARSLECSPPSTQRASDPGGAGVVSRRASDKRHLPFTFGDYEVDDEALVSSGFSSALSLTLTQRPSQLPVPSTLPLTFVIYERLVDTRLLRRGRVLPVNLARDLLILASLVVFVLVAGFHALSTLAPEPKRAPSTIGARAAPPVGLGSIPASASVVVPARSSTIAEAPVPSVESAQAVDRSAPLAAAIAARRQGSRRPTVLPANPY